MFRNRSFRTKLAFAIAPPLVVLMVLVATVVRPRLDEASDAAHKGELATLATENMQVRDELQHERDATIQRIVSRPASTVDLDAVRGRTDARAAALGGRLDAISPAGEIEREAFATTRGALTTLVALREQIDTGTVGPLQIYEEYERLLSDHLAISQAIVRGSNDPDLLRQATANLSFLEYKDAIARTNSYIGLRVESGTVTQTDMLQVSADLAVAEEYHAQFLQAASERSVEIDRAGAASSEMAGALALREEILLAGSRNRTPTVSPAAWWQAAQTQLVTLESVEDASFGDFSSLAAYTQDQARSDTTVYLAVLGIGVIVAALAALAFGRSIATRLAKVSDDAHAIASERLPEVLDALRNPTPEVLANALPQVRSDARDEIGSLAESFNTVLRTSVETSINHAQRRAATLTNILVNLGRRNQALIDRQLELVDELESTQRDPDVLRGLFQLDHMITSLRRNAENLLVLASDTQSRSWSAPVPMVDVVRGAVAEVEDMSRISLELDLTDSSMLTGRYAVDLSHLVAELVDNGLSFSPPTARVHLRSERTAAHYRVWVLDSGLGMSDAELADANARVSNPPDVDELSADRIGFQVVGRLARRLGVSVRLQPNPGGGLAASVTVPAALLDTSPAAADEPPPVIERAPIAALAAAPVEPAPTEPAPVERAPAELAPAEREPVEREPARLSLDPAPVSSAAPLLAPPRTPRPPMPRRSWLDGSADTPASQPAVTASGLERRVPGQAFVGEVKAQQFDSGQFRRLPMPGDRAGMPLDDDVTLAERRLRALSGLQSGAGRAREEADDDSTPGAL